MIKMFETWIYGKDGKRAIEKDPYLSYLVLAIKHAAGIEG